MNEEFRTDWENLQVGNYVFTQCESRMGSGGYPEFGDKVVKITKTKIKTHNESEGEFDCWDKKEKFALNEPWAYYLCAFKEKHTNPF